jgi:hypothetical protein
MTTDTPGPARVDAEPIHRPGPFQLLRYSLGGRLDARHKTWVLHDVTCRTWLLRHVGRTFLIVVPLFAVYMAFMPTSLGIRLLTGLTFSGGLFMFSFVNALIDTDRRAVRAGYGMGLPAQLRGQQAAERQRLASRRRRERIAERRTRRTGHR